MLQSLRIQNFKSITDSTIVFERVNVIVGPNNAGKSSVLQALQFAVSVAQSIGLDGTAWIKDALAGTLSSQQLVYSPLRDIQALAAGGQLKQSIEQAIKMNLTTDDLGESEISVRRGKNKNIAINIKGRQLGERLQDIEKPFSVFVPGLAGIPAYEEFKSSGLVRRAAAKGDANSVFRNVLWLLKTDSSAWSQFVADLQNMFPGTELDIEFEPNIDEHIAATVRIGEGSLPIDSSGTGILQAIQILAYVNVYKPSILILDEPDSHLHPDNQRKLARLIVELAYSRDFQVILSTHSRHLLDELSDMSVKINWLASGEVKTTENDDRIKILLELGALDSGDRLRNGLTPCVLLTEDKIDTSIKCLLEASGFSPDDVDFWAYKGCTKIEAALILIHFIHDHAPGTIILLHKDKDFDSDEKCDDFIKKLGQHDVKVFLTDGVDVESHFLNPLHLAHVVPEIDYAEAEILIEQATKETAEKSIEKFINVRVVEAQQARNRNGGDQINSGEIALQARNDYLSNPLRFRHGKTVLNQLKALLHQRVKRNVNLVQVSPSISNPFLKSIANDLSKSV